MSCQELPFHLIVESHLERMSNEQVGVDGLVERVAMGLDVPNEGVEVHRSHLQERAL